MTNKPYGYVVDSHCHLNYEGLIDDLDGVVARAREAGVGCMLAINTKISEFDAVHDISKNHDHIFATVGVHPHEAENEPDIALDALLSRSQHPKVVGIGETGLDYYYDTAPRDMQIDNFTTHITAARETGLPVIIHTRDADDDCVRILREEYEKGAFPGLIHCFTATQDLANAVLDLGLSISISGIVTFKNAQALRDVVSTVPLDRLLVETDSPFLAPIPHRGRTCEPAYVVDTLNYIAEIRGISADELREITTANFFNLFSKVTPPPAWPVLGENT